MTHAVERPLWEDDGILADRVRSSLGPLLKRLDQPRVHITSSRGTVSLHGDVTDRAAGAAIESAIADVLGVTGVVSHLRVGLVAGDSVPSEGHRSRRSPLLQRLHGIARDCGYVAADEQRFVLHGVLGVFAARLPEGLRRRFLTHLPQDVRALARPRRFLDSAAGTATTRHDFVQVTAMATLTDHAGAERLLRQVLAELRRHSIDDAAAIGAGLPTEIAELWGPVAARPRPHAHDTALLDRPASAVMTRDVVTVRGDASLFDAFELMARAHVHHLPVVRDDGRCVAIVDAVSVAERLPEAWVSRGTVALHRAGALGALSVRAEDTVGRAARLMHAAGVDACCVVDVHDRLIGLITARDLIAALAAADHSGL